MLDPQTYNSAAREQLAQLPKLGQKVIKSAVDAYQDGPRPEGTLSWFRVEQKDGEVKLTAVPNTTQVDVTSVNIHAEEVAAPQELKVFNYKIDLQAKLEGFKESYAKNYSLSKSHNLMVARFAELKSAFYGYLLATLGVSSEDIRKLQKQAIKGAVKQNKQLFEENEYNSELLAIVGGGGKKKARAQQKVVGEIRQQLIAQARNLGLGDHYTTRRVIEIQVEQCQKIMSKFREEKNGLEYQLKYYGVN
jgi:hypothetical protein